MSLFLLQPLVRLYDYKYDYSNYTTTQLIIMLNIIDVVWPTINFLNKYENVGKFSTNWPTFNLGLALV